MSLASAIIRASEEARRFPPGAVLVLGGEVEAVPAERLLAASVPGERALLVPADRGAWSIAGIGAAARVSCDGGPARFARARDRARALFAAVIRHEDVADAPAPRLVGGFSFDAAPRHEAPWEAFGAADFALPRWSYWAPPEGGQRGCLRLAVTPLELKSAERLLAELSAIEATLAAAVPEGRSQTKGPLSARSASPSVGPDIDRDDGWAGLATEGRSATERPLLARSAGPNGGEWTGLAPPVARAPPGIRLDEPPFAPWETLVRACVAAIAEGTLQKLVPARRLHATALAPFDPAAVRPEPGTTAFRFDREGVTFIGRTPERLVQLAGNTVRCDALAGSIPRAGDDAAEAAALLASDKDLREHELVVRGIVEDLGRFAGMSSLPHAPVVRTLRTVHHLHTPIEGTVLGTPHLFDLAAALHPTAAVAGRPRAAAMAFLAGHEDLDRGWYAAPIGWVDAEGEGELWVALRSAVLHGAEAWAYAGAGVVEGSEPAAEWRETAAKAAAILGALGVQP